MASRLIFIQPSLLSYRRDFFERVVRGHKGEVRVYFSRSDMGALSCDETVPSWAECIGPVRSVISGVDWQKNAIAVPIQRGDIVVISGAPRCLSNLVLLLRARLKGATTIWWGHYRSASSGRFRTALRLALAHSAHGLLFYTDTEVHQYHLRTAFRDRRPVHALNNGIDTEAIHLLRDIYDPSARARAFLFIGRLTKKAGVCIVIEALAHPAAAGIQLHVIGDGEEGARLKALAFGRGVSDRIYWHGGTTDEAKIAAVANQCRGFVYPGEVGLSLIHAMSYGLPAVLHDDPLVQMPEYAAFSGGETGCSFRRGDVVGLAGAMGGVVDDTDALSAYSREALRRTEYDYTTRGMASRMLALIDSIEAMR